ncbi:MAG: hypothetical protein ACRC7N_08435 [Clostridium sp.]
MKYVTPANNYAIVFPNGKVTGVEEKELALGYINTYYRDRLDQIHEKEDYEELEKNEETTWLEIYTRLGVDEGECRVFNIDELIEHIREAAILEDEKEDLISRLMEDKIDLNINDFGIDDILMDTPNYLE